MTIARRLRLLLGVPLAILILLGAFTQWELRRVEAKGRFVADVQIVSLASLGAITRHTSRLRIELRSHLLTADAEARTAVRSRFETTEAEASRVLREYGASLVADDRDRALLDEYRAQYTAWLAGAREVLRLDSAGQREEAVRRLLGPMTELGDRLSRVSADWVDYNEKLARDTGRELISEVRSVRRNGIVAVLAALLLSGYFGVATRRRIVGPIGALKASVETIAAGDFSQKVPGLACRDETGDLARSIQVLKEGAAAMEEQRWVKTTAAAVTGELQGACTVEEFGRRFLDRLVPAVGGGVAGFWVAGEGSGSLRRIAGYGLSGAALAVEAFQVGEGLVGQCARERKPVALAGLPPGYLGIGSGLGAAAPSSTGAWPLVSPDGLLGVVEMAAFREPGPREKALFEELLPVVAMSLEILQRNVRTRELLARTQEQARQLEEQTGELTQSQQELLSQKDELVAQQHELAEAKLKAEEATSMKSMFLANMSHEIRTPMNAVIGLSHLALKTPLNAKQRDYLCKIHNAGTSLLSIINDILDFSKIEAGRLDIEEVDFQLDDVIGTVTTVTGQKAHDKGLEFLVETGGELPPTLRGDPLRLGQVLTNLVNNAVKFTERGEVHVKISVVRQTGDKVELRFAVRDTGPGMTREQAGKLFQPFTQADMSTTRKHGGTGLGLTICRRLVELMGGQIWLESEPGVGSTFTFTVWLGIGAADASGRTLPRNLQDFHVLVVDDNAAAREILVDSLRTLTRSVDAVSSGPEALAAIRERDAEEPYEVVFMDWRMPGMDGLQATRLIRNDESLRKKPAVIIVTAFGREEVREEAESLKVAGFLVKPVTRSMLVDSLVAVASAESGGGAPVAAPPPEAGPSLAGARLLLTEDNEINQQIAIELLEGAGAAVTVANNGLEAVGKLEADPTAFDLVLMDLQMPEMDGYQATTRIRSEARFAALPIIAMTAHATMEERQRCLAAGMNDHLSKPINPVLLLETVSRFVRDRSGRPRPGDPAGVPGEAGPSPVGAATGASPAVPAPAPGPAAGPSRDADDLPVVEGLNTADGLMRVAGNRVLYRKLLRQFAEKEAGTPARVVALLAGGDRAAAERAAHTLKGLAGSLGAPEVHGLAAEVERGIAGGLAPAGLEPLCLRLAGRMDALMGGLKPALGLVPPAAGASPPAAVPPAPADFDAARLDAVSAAMVAHLAEFDAAAADHLDAHEAEFRALLEGAAFESFQRQVRDYAFAEALEALRAARLRRGFNPSQS